MRATLLLIPVVVFFSSCSKYQCLTISSDNTARNERNEFVVETDTLRINYDFYNTYGTVQVSVFNKSAEGIQVDWARSFVIVGDNPASFFNPVMRVQGELDKTSSSNTVTLNATASQTQELQFIPPQTAVSRPGLSLTRGRFIDDNSYSFKKESVRIGGFPKKIKRAKIEKDDSPLQFRVYLTLIPEPGKTQNARVFDRSFYVSELIRTKAEAPAIFSRRLNGNMIIMERSTITGTLLITTGTVGIIALLAVAAGG